MNEALFQKCFAAMEFYNIPSVKKSLESENLVRGAFERAYFDTQRTLRWIGKNPDRVQIKQSVFDIVSDFYGDIVKNIESYSLRDYDGSLGIVFNKIISMSDALGHKFTLGQAQKITNMFFKYMLLVDDRLNVHLNYFHVPLDGVILKGSQSVSIQTKYGRVQNHVCRGAKWKIIARIWICKTVCAACMKILSFSSLKFGATGSSR